ncbi:MAG: VCBS repeat-containing protein [Acidobacteria bacterium]|nr:VCBS repeat-containing protein [Acidobacteriota bacterium]
MWIMDGRGGILFGREQMTGRAGERGAWTWTRLESPDGFMADGVAAGPSGTLYAKGTWVGSRRSVVLARDPDGSWRDLRAPTMGTIFDIQVDHRGLLWILGEWRELYRYDGGRWIADPTPRPYHNALLVPNRDGSLWIWAATTGHSAVYHRSAQGAWTVSWEGTDRASVLHADEASFTLQGPDDLVRVAAPGRATAPSPSGFGGWREWPVAMDSPASGWMMRGDDLLRCENNSWSRVPVPTLPERVPYLAYLPGRGLFATGVSGTLFHLANCPAETPTPSAGALRQLLLPSVHVRAKRQFGGAVLTLGARELLYVVDHEGPNVTFDPARYLPGLPTPDPNEWRALSDRLHNIGPTVEGRWNHNYDQAALAADLNGDGLEDLLLFAMYDRTRLYRNVRDRHFVDWTEPSGLADDREMRPEGGCLLDADQDEDLDLYVTSRFAPDRLLLNNGAAMFQDDTASSGIESADGGSMPACLDLDGDGDTDIAVPTWGRGLLVHENLARSTGRPTFRTRALLRDAGARFSSLYLNALAPGDVDGDGLPDLFVTNQNGCDLFLRNLGGLQFRPDPLFLPANQPCGTSNGANFLDFDHDRDLDLIITGAGGTRYYVSGGDRLTWTGNVAGSDVYRQTELQSVGSVLMDLDRDGDLDAIQLGDDIGMSVQLDVGDGSDTIALRVLGPPANRSAVGTRVALRPAEGGPTVRRQLAGSSSYGSMDTKWVSFTGLERGREYDATISLGSRTRIVRRLRAPAREVVPIEPGATTALLGRVLYRTRHALAEEWIRTFALLLGIGALVLVALTLVLFRNVAPTMRDFAWVPAATLASLLAVALLPLDPGRPRALASAGLGHLLAGLALAVWRSRRAVRPAPELLTELNFAVRTFQHNQIPQRVLGGLQFTLRNLPSTGLSPKHSALLRGDVLSFREVVLPELVTIRRLADAAGVAAGDAGRLLGRTRRDVLALARWLLTGDASAPAGRLAPLADDLRDVERWMAELRTESDRRLALDLAASLAAYVESRRALAPCAIELEDRLRRDARVRCLLPELYRVLDVLLENAVQAMRGQPEPRVRIHAAHREPRRVAILFQDSGPGLDTADQQHVFTLGFSAGAVSDSRGYGLYYVKRTVERFGGRVSVESAPGLGATFVVEFELLDAGRPVAAEVPA